MAKNWTRSVPSKDLLKMTKAPGFNNFITRKDIEQEINRRVKRNARRNNPKSPL